MWKDTENTCFDDEINHCACDSKTENKSYDDYQDDEMPTMDDDAQKHGYHDYEDYCDEYW